MCLVAQAVAVATELLGVKGGRRLGNVTLVGCRRNLFQTVSRAGKVELTKKIIVKIRGWLMLLER